MLRLLQGRHSLVIGWCTPHTPIQCNWAFLEPCFTVPNRWCNPLQSGNYPRARRALIATAQGCNGQGGVDHSIPITPRGLQRHEKGCRHLHLCSRTEATRAARRGRRRVLRVIPESQSPDARPRRHQLGRMLAWPGARCSLAGQSEQQKGCRE